MNGKKAHGVLQAMLEGRRRLSKDEDAAIVYCMTQLEIDAGRQALAEVEEGEVTERDDEVGS